jgi:hypothetical protein
VLKASHSAACPFKEARSPLSPLLHRASDQGGSFFDKLYHRKLQLQRFSQFLGFSTIMGKSSRFCQAAQHKRLVAEAQFAFQLVYGIDPSV